MMTIVFFIGDLFLMFAILDLSMHRQNGRHFDSDLNKEAGWYDYLIITDYTL